MSQATCQNCKYLNGNECRRRSPSPTVQLVLSEQLPAFMNGDPIYPRVQMWDWCGDYEPRETRSSEEQE